MALPPAAELWRPNHWRAHLPRDSPPDCQMSTRAGLPRASPDQPGRPVREPPQPGGDRQSAGANGRNRRTTSRRSSTSISRARTYERRLRGITDFGVLWGEGQEPRIIIRRGTGSTARPATSRTRPEHRLSAHGGDRPSPQYANIDGPVSRGRTQTLSQDASEDAPKAAAGWRGDASLKCPSRAVSGPQCRVRPWTTGFPDCRRAVAGHT